MRRWTRDDYGIAVLTLAGVALVAFALANTDDIGTFGTAIALAVFALLIVVQHLRRSR